MIATEPKFVRWSCSTALMISMLGCDPQSEAAPETDEQSEAGKRDEVGSGDPVLQCVADRLEVGAYVNGLRLEAGPTSVWLDAEHSPEWLYERDFGVPDAITPAHLTFFVYAQDITDANDCGVSDEALATLLQPTLTFHATDAEGNDVAARTIVPTWSGERVPGLENNIVYTFGGDAFNPFSVPEFVGCNNGPDACTNLPVALERFTSKTFATVDGYFTVEIPGLAGVQDERLGTFNAEGDSRVGLAVSKVVSSVCEGFYTDGEC